MLIIATCSNQDFLRELGFEGIFNIKVNVPELKFDFLGENEISKVIKEFLGFQSKGFLGRGKGFKIPIKNLLFALTFIKDKQVRSEKELEEQFQEAMDVIGYQEELEDNIGLGYDS